MPSQAASLSFLCIGICTYHGSCDDDDDGGYGDYGDDAGVDGHEDQDGDEDAGEDGSVVKEVPRKPAERSGSVICAYSYI